MSSSQPGRSGVQTHQAAAAAVREWVASAPGARKQKLERAALRRAAPYQMKWMGICCGNNDSRVPFTLLAAP